MFWTPAELSAFYMAVDKAMESEAVSQMAVTCDAAMVCSGVKPGCALLLQQCIRVWMGIYIVRRHSACSAYSAYV
jgi:hypothetical protein